MTVLDQNDTTFQIDTIPRYYDDLTGDYTLSVIDEDTDLELTKTLGAVVKEGGYLKFTVSATLTENKSFKVKITDNGISQVIYRGKAFVTDQTVQNYQING